MINKVCASGMKAITLAAQSLQTGENSVMVAGGFESMSNAPFYLKREEPAYGGAQLPDGMIQDGLIDGTIRLHMVECGEDTAKNMGITREEQVRATVSTQ